MSVKLLDNSYVLYTHEREAEERLEIAFEVTAEGALELVGYQNAEGTLCQFPDCFVLDEIIESEVREAVALALATNAARVARDAWHLRDHKRAVNLSRFAADIGSAIHEERRHA